MREKIVCLVCFTLEIALLSTKSFCLLLRIWVGWERLRRMKINWNIRKQLLWENVLLLCQGGEFWTPLKVGCAGCQVTSHGGEGLEVE